jgi:hypothetical protein
MGYIGLDPSGSGFIVVRTVVNKAINLRIT